jgi:hypothetical protein
MGLASSGVTPAKAGVHSRPVGLGTELCKIGI